MHFQKWSGDLGRRDGTRYSEKGKAKPLENFENHLDYWCRLLQGGRCHCIFTQLSVWGMWKLLLQRAEVGHHLPWGPWHGLEPGAPHLLPCTDNPQQEADLSGLFAWRQDWLPWVQFEFAVTLPMKPHVSGGLQSWIHKEPGGLWLYSYLFR